MQKFNFIGGKSPSEREGIQKGMVGGIINERFK